MDHPTLTDYVGLIYTLFDTCVQQTPTAKRGCPCTYLDKALIVFFVLMHLHRIATFKTQQRWRQAHPQACVQLGFATIPHRTTLSRRYKALYATIQDVVTFV